MIAAALLLPKGDLHRAAAITTQANASQPASAALMAGNTLQVETRLGDASAPAFFSVCHGFSATHNTESPYQIDYSNCPIKRTQVVEHERFSLTLPESVETVLIEVWPLQRVEQARYILTTPAALQRDGLDLR